MASTEAAHGVEGLECGDTITVPTISFRRVRLRKEARKINRDCARACFDLEGAAQLSHQRVVVASLRGELDL